MATLLSTDRLDVAVDEDGDILIDSDGLHFVSGLEGVAQLCRIALRLYKEEWFANLDVGMPWFQEILGEKYDEQAIRRRCIETLLGVPGVISINSAVVTFSGRKVSLTWSVKTQFGDTVPDTLDLAGGGS